MEANTWIAILGTVTTLLTVYSGIITFMLLRFPSRREFQAHEKLDSVHMCEIRTAMKAIQDDLRQMRELREKDQGRSNL